MPIVTAEGEIVTNHVLEVRTNSAVLNVITPQADGPKPIVLEKGQTVQIAESAPGAALVVYGEDKGLLFAEKLLPGTAVQYGLLVDKTSGVQVVNPRDRVRVE